MNDPTEEIRREMLQEGNKRSAGVLNAAGMLIQAILGPDTEVTEEEGTEILKTQEEIAAAMRRAQLVADYGADNVFDTDQLREHFEVIGFRAPLVVVTRKSDNQKGSLEFEGHPRFYFGFQAHKP